MRRNNKREWWNHREIDCSELSNQERKNRLIRLRMMLRGLTKEWREVDDWLVRLSARKRQLQHLISQCENSQPLDRKP